MTHSADIKRIKEDLQKLNNESLTTQTEFEKLLPFDTEIEVKTFWRIQGESKTHSQRLAKLTIYSHMITQKELEVLLESLKMIYMKHEDGEVRMLVKQNHEYLNC
jgi:hypothetical protein